MLELRVGRGRVRADRGRGSASAASSRPAARRSWPTSTSATASRSRFGATASAAAARAVPAAARGRVRAGQPGLTRRAAAGTSRDRRWERTWTDGRVRGRGRGGARRDRARRRLPGQPRPAPRPRRSRATRRGARRRGSRPFGRSRRPFRGDGWAIVSALAGALPRPPRPAGLDVPIKGTRPLGEHARGSAKDAAEHVMIVDLERNDLSRVCEPGSVRWPELMAERALAGVEHLVSTVEGTLRDGRRARRAARGDVPGRLRDGRAEDRGRRPDRGARAGRPRRVDGRARPRAGQRRPRARADDPHVRGRGGRIHLWVGGGIVWDSDPARRSRSRSTKARPLLAAIGAPLRGAVATGEPLAVAVAGPRARRSRRARAARRRRGASCAAARHSRRCASTAAGRSGSASTSSAWRVSARSDRPAGRRRGRARGARRAALERGGAPDAVLRLYLDARPRRTAAGLALVSDAAGRTRRAAGARPAAGLAARPCRAEAPWLLPGVKSTSYAVNMAAEAEAQTARRRRRRLRRRVTGIVLEGPVDERLVASGDTLCTPSLDLGILAGETRAALLELAPAAWATRSRRALPARRAARRRRGVHVLVGARGAAGRGARRTCRSAAARPPTSFRRRSGGRRRCYALSDGEAPPGRHGARERRARARADRVGCAVRAPDGTVKVASGASPARARRADAVPARPVAARRGLRAAARAPPPAPEARLPFERPAGARGASRSRSTVGSSARAPSLDPRRARGRRRARLARARPPWRCAAASSPPITAPSTSRSGPTSTTSRRRRSTTAAARISSARCSSPPPRPAPSPRRRPPSCAARPGWPARSALSAPPSRCSPG